MNLYLIIEEKALEAPRLSFPSHKMGHILRPKPLTDKSGGITTLWGADFRSWNLEHSTHSNNYYWPLDRQVLGHPGYQVT